ncbi:hypothetical protein TAGGR_3130 [Thermodesulfovibrio aggregans]|uniref:Uncharacterized protein n=1 Tax=Thermodesulfovibrio aggregans TaxID=86166 RepID=A0A0U9HTA3_9BACT|nr:hypothetical protein [Thermodesulfovibrio aggregans]GAQ95657.1 hypothetical protein TAGGR_3130 [Thermodesulfovibrio aggregans]
MKKISLFFTTTILIMVLLFCLRLILQQKNFIAEAKKAENPIESIRYYERAILSYTPLSPYNKKAIGGILEQCKKIESDEQRLYCYETLRSSLYQIKSFYQPYKEEIRRIEPLIADLKASEMIKWKYNKLSEKDYKTLYSYHMEILKYDGSPSIFWSFVSVFSLFAWIGSVCLIIIKGLKVPFDRKYLITGSAGFIIFFSLWVIGLYFA